MGQDTWIQFYDAELLRLRAHTLDDDERRIRHLRAAIELARNRARSLRITRGRRRFRASSASRRGQALVEATAACPPTDVARVGPCASTARVTIKEPSGHPRRRHGRTERRVAAQRGRLADRFESITVYQRGWRLGGKGASSRGRNGRIEEHGLHVWLGCYDNAFALLRECYAELDRATTDPGAPIHTWDQALIPADSLGIADRLDDDWLVWPGALARNDELPGDPHGTGREMTAVGIHSTGPATHSRLRRFAARTTQ